MRRLALVLALALAAAGLRGADPAEAPAPPPGGGDGAAIDDAVRDLLKQPRYAWRSPRAAQAAAEDSVPLQMLRGTLKAMGDVVTSVGKSLEGVGRWLARLLEELMRHLPKDWMPQRTAADTPDLGEAPLWAAWILLAAVSALLGVLLARGLRQRAAPALAAPAALPAVDLAAPQLSGDELPEDAWLGLARDLAARGEHRLALRAYYLAGLNALGRARLLALSPSRSVGDYRRQLARRAATGAPLRETFDAFSGLYEQCWYGSRTAGEPDCAQAQRWQEGLHGGAF
ncbi:MAG TPA: DUF4129 domain-containing protein [bacterium]|jgi:hypothetical protein|nr:DUF4129 domain-containing protein [bacterium]